MNNIGEPVHKQVIDAGVLPVLVKIVKKKVCPFSEPKPNFLSIQFLLKLILCP